MSDNHHNNGHNENKPVAFTTPLILGSITIFIILLFVSLGNPCSAECCADEDCATECSEAAEKGGHGAHAVAHKAGCGECDNCKAGKECSHHEAGCGECDNCKAGKECSHHEAGCGECDNCKEGKECSHHEKHHDESANEEHSH